MNPETVGLIAGSGRFPILFAQEAKRQGMRVVAIALSGVTDPALKEIADETHVFRLGQISAPLEAFKKAGVRRAVMVGKVQHVSLFGGVLPDLRAVKLLSGLKDKRTDTLLGALADEFAREGVELLPSTMLLAHLLAKPGCLTRREPTEAELADMDLGWRAAKALSGFDIGQTVAVQSGAVIAVEAMEGTDAAVLRAGELARSHGDEPGIVVVKVAKPRQDVRFDLPVLGIDSFGPLRRSGATAVAVEAGKTLIFDQEELLRKADEIGLAVVALEDGKLPERQSK
ncbi:MAG: UDP-2,3-diacylglucosamine diphosphatase LpxI [Elusimicrobiota bacterium]